MGSSSTSSSSSLDLGFVWREKRQHMFIYWCFAHFIHGMIHSIRYSSQYLYFKDVMKVSNPDLLYGMSVSFIGVTGVIFPLVISPFVDQTRKIRQVTLLVNALGFIGNLIYAMPFSPVLPLLGQFLAGTTPAFGVIAMGEISRMYSPEKLTKKISALSLVYSVGTFTSIGLVFCFLYVDFSIGVWHINFANMPGIALSIFFVVSGVLSLFLVSDMSKEFDMKLEERIKRSSCSTTPRDRRSPTTPETRTPETRSRRSSPQGHDYFLSPSSNTNLVIPEIIEPESSSDLTRDASTTDQFKVIKDVGEPYYFAREDDINRKLSPPFNFPKFKNNSDEKLSEMSEMSARHTGKSLWKIVRHRTAFALMALTFVESFVYCIIVTCLPVLAAKFLNWGKVELAFLSLVNKFLSVIISGSVFCLTNFFEDYLLLTYGLMFSCLALLSLSVLTLVTDNSQATIGLLILIACVAIAGVPLVITSTRSMLAKLVPSEVQSLTEAVRMSVFEAAFVPAGFLVPIVNLNVTATALFLLSVTVFAVGYLVYEREQFIDVREEDEYWLQIHTPIPTPIPE